MLVNVKCCSKHFISSSHLREAHFFPHLLRVTWICTPSKIAFHWEKPVPLLIGGANPHGVSVVMTKSLSCWWPDGGMSVVMTTSCMGHTQALTINRSVFTENRASTSCFSPNQWHELFDFMLVFFTWRILQYYWQMKSIEGYILLWNGNVTTVGCRNMTNKSQHPTRALGMLWLQSHWLL